MRPNSKQNFSTISVPNSGPGEIQRLADQVSDIAQKLSSLGIMSVGREGTERSPLDTNTLRRMLNARRARNAHFPEGLFADPAWDILLDLLVAKMMQARVSVSSVCLASNVPQTTALRWIKTLEVEGLIERRADQFDGRRYFLEITPLAQRSLEQYFASIGLDLII